MQNIFTSAANDPGAERYNKILKAAGDQIRSEQSEAEKERERAYKETAAALFRSGKEGGENGQE